MTTTTIRASRRAPGTTGPTSTGSSPSWSTTPTRSSPPLDGVELDDEQAEAVGLLALVAGQDVEPGDSDGTWRIAPVTRPDRIVSVHRSRVPPRAQDHVELSRRVQSPRRGRARHRADHRLRADRRQRRRRPGRSRSARRRDRPGRGARRLRLRLRRVPRPPRRTRSHGDDQTDPAAPPRSPAGSPSTTSPSTPTAGTVTCPNGITVTISPRPARPSSGRRCDGCPLRSALHHAPDTARQVNVHEHHDLLAAARAHALTPAFTEPYRQHRPMVERSIAWLVRRGGRKVRYRGIARNRIGLAHRCAAINLRRLLNLGLALGQRLARSPPEPAGPGLTTRERHLRAHTHPARPTHTLKHRLFGRSCPRTHQQRYDHSQQRERATCSAVS